MAVALVGTIGAALQGAPGAAVTPAWGAGESRTAGNLLVCFASFNSTGAGAPVLPAAPTGWTTLSGTAGSGFYWKFAAGGDAAPVIANGGSTDVQTLQLAEFSGVHAVEQAAHTTTPVTTSPVVETTAAADAAAGDLVCGAAAISYSAAASKTFTDTLNNGMAANVTDSAALSVASHYHFFWALTTSNAAADSDSLAYTTTKLLSCSLAIQSFSPTAGGAPATVRPRQRVYSQAVRTAATRCWSRRPGGIVGPHLWSPQEV